MKNKATTPPKFSAAIRETPATLKNKSEKEIREEFRVLRRHILRRRAVFEKHGDIENFPIKGELPTMRGMETEEVKQYVLEWGKEMRKKSTIWSEYRGQLKYQMEYFGQWYDVNFETKTDKKGREYYTEGAYKDMKELREILNFAAERYGEFYSYDSGQIIEAWKIGRKEGMNKKGIMENLDLLYEAAMVFRDVEIYGRERIKERGGKTWEEVQKYAGKFKNTFGEI